MSGGRLKAPKKKKASMTSGADKKTLCGRPTLAAATRRQFESVDIGARQLKNIARARASRGAKRHIKAADSSDGDNAARVKAAIARRPLATRRLKGASVVVINFFCVVAACARAPLAQRREARRCRMQIRRPSLPPPPPRATTTTTTTKRRHALELRKRGNGDCGGARARAKRPNNAANRQKSRHESSVDCLRARRSASAAIAAALASASPRARARVSSCRVHVFSQRPLLLCKQRRWRRRSQSRVCRERAIKRSRALANTVRLTSPSSALIEGAFRSAKRVLARATRASGAQFGGTQTRADADANASARARAARKRRPPYRDKRRADDKPDNSRTRRRPPPPPPSPPPPLLACQLPSARSRSYAT